MKDAVRVHIGFVVDREIKEALELWAAAEHRSISSQIEHLLSKNKDLEVYRLRVMGERKK